MARLGDLFLHIRNGANIKQGLDNTGYPITRIETISNRTVDRNKMGYAGITDFEKYSDFVMQDGDILMSHINSEIHLGKTALYEKEGDEIIIHGMNLLSLRPNKDLITSKYAFYYLSSQSFLRQIPNITKKSVNQASFTVSALKELAFPIPSIEEQKKITLDLDKVNDLVSLRKQQLSKLDELVKSRFVELFGDPEDSTTKWERTTFSSVCIDMHQGINTVADEVEYVNSGFPIIQSKNITSGYLDLEDVRYVTESDYEYYRNKYNPKPSDLLVCNIGTIGKSLIVEKEVNFLIAWNLFLIKLNKELVSPIFVKVFIELLNQQNYFEKYMTGGTVKFVNKKTMGNISTPLPPMALQEQFATFVEQTDKSKFEIQQSLEKLETLKKALMQKYFG